MKKCAKCKADKNESEFSFKNKKKNILHSYCKECKRELDNISYSENKNNRKEKIRKRANDSLINLRQYLNDLKKNKSCIKCGENRWWVLDFHHVNDKEYQISQLVKHGSLELLKKEVNKCVVLCANCHRDLHHNELR